MTSAYLLLGVAACQMISIALGRQYQSASAIMTVLLLITAVGGALGLFARTWRSPAHALTAAALLVIHATVRPDADPNALSYAFRLAGLVVCAVLWVDAGWRLTTSVSVTVSVQAVLVAVLGLAVVGLVAERFPGGRLDTLRLSASKGPVPHRAFGLWYEPGSRVRTFHASNPRGAFDGPPPLRRQWRLNLHSGQDSATMAYPDSGRTLMRVEIERAKSGLAYGIQLNKGHLSVRTGTRYRLRFSARADSARSIGVGVAEFHAPWDWLGYSREIAIDTNWRHVDDTLTVVRNDNNARVHLDLAAARPSVELTDASLIDLSTDLTVEPDSLPYSLTYDFNELGCRGLRAESSRLANRILVLGDSHSLGLGVREQDALPSRLAAILQSHGAQATEVLNCGVPGWGTRQQRLFYDWISARVRAQNVILVMTANDARLDRGEGMSADPVPVDTSRIRRELTALARAVRARGAVLLVASFRTAPDPRWPGLLHTLAQVAATERFRVIDLSVEPTVGGRWQTFVIDSVGPRLPNEAAHHTAALVIARALGVVSAAPPP